MNHMINIKKYIPLQYNQTSQNAYLMNLNIQTLPNIDENINTFFYYIRMPICSSSIIIKKVIKMYIKSSPKEINFNLLKLVVNKLSLNWKTELSLLRRHLTNWLYKNRALLETIYPTLFAPSANVLNLIKYIIVAYRKGKHPLQSPFSLFEFLKILESNQIQDRKLIRENAI